MAAKMARIPMRRLGTPEEIADMVRFLLSGSATYVTGPLITAFGANGDAASLMRFFCLFVAGSFMFNGALFVANAAFNNLGFPLYSTLFNWGRATLGVIPFVYFGKAYGPEGVLAGWGIGAVAFGTLSIIVCFSVLKKMPQTSQQTRAPDAPPTAQSPFSTGKASLIAPSNPTD